MGKSCLSDVSFTAVEMGTCENRTTHNAQRTIEELLAIRSHPFHP